MSQHFYPGTAVTGDRAAAATVQGAPCFTDAGQPSVVVQIQCSLIPYRSRQAPVMQRGRSPRKHRVYVPKAAQASPLYTHARLSGLCPGTLCPTGAARRPRHGPQEPPGAAPISFQDPGRGFPVRAAGGPAQGRSDAQGAARCHAWPCWRLISAAAAARISGAGRSCSPVRPAAARRAGYSYMYTYTDSLKHGYKVFA